VFTVESAENTSSPSIDCECLNGTYIFDDLFDPIESLGGLFFRLRSNDFGPGVPNSCPTFSLPDPPLAGQEVRSEVQAQAGCFATQNVTENGKLEMIVDGGDATVGFWARHVADSNFGAIAEANLRNGWVVPSFSVDGITRATVPCGSTCDDLVDAVLALFPRTVGLFSSGNSDQCKTIPNTGGATDATLTVEYQ
jgi:hypothetical protein